jgi:UDP-N-acetylglucosamine transferase subunit ALG13
VRAVSHDAALDRLPDRLPDRPRLFVTIGTDHHPFGRLVDWAGEWARNNPEWDVALQHGRTPPPAPVATLEAFAFLDHARLLELLSSSAAVVCHGGPATITEARRTGHTPIVVPRDPQHGEHVDGHQLLFARRLAGAGLAHLVTDARDLDGAVRTAHRAAPGEAFAGRRAPVPPGVHRVGQVAEEVARAARARRR